MAILSAFSKAVRPKRSMTMSEWALENMRLSAESSAEPGPISFEDAVYQPGIMDAVSQPGINEVYVRTSSQVGKSTILRACIGYFAEHDPCPVLVGLPTEKLASAFSVDFVDTLIRDTPCLTPLFDSTQQTSTALHKTYPGGHLTLVGANNPQSLAMRPIRVVLGDEIDRWPLSAGKEGSPLTLARARQKTYRPFQKLAVVSTPVDLETSLVNELFLAGDQRYFFVTCPDCSHEQHLEWRFVKWPKGQPEKAEYTCSDCGTCWSQRELRAAVKKGFWRATNLEAPADVASFSLNELYSPWSTMADMARAWEEAEGDPEKEKAFTNTSLGLPWSGDQLSTASEDSLAARRETYPGRVAPHGSGKITAGVDVQRDRLEVMVAAWGVDDECWLLEHVKLYGDPSGQLVWLNLEEYLLRKYPHATANAELGIETVFIDSGGLSTQQVYDFSKKHIELGRNWYAIKGKAGEGQKIVEKANWAKTMDKSVKLYMVYVDDAKDWLYAHYKYEREGPGYIHIPETFGEDLIKQMTAEWRVQTTDKHGKVKMVWEKKKGARNEGLDLLVYAYAAHKFTDIDMVHRVRRLAAGTPEPGIDAVQLGRQMASGAAPAAQAAAAPKPALDPLTLGRMMAAA